MHVVTPMRSFHRTPLYIISQCNDYYHLNDTSLQPLCDMCFLTKNMLFYHLNIITLLYLHYDMCYFGTTIIMGYIPQAQSTSKPIRISAGDLYNLTHITIIQRLKMKCLIEITIRSLIYNN